MLRDICDHISPEKAQIIQRDIIGILGPSARNRAAAWLVANATRHETATAFQIANELRPIIARHPAAFTDSSVRRCWPEIDAGLLEAGLGLGGLTRHFVTRPRREDVWFSADYAGVPVNTKLYSLVRREGHASPLMAVGAETIW